MSAQREILRMAIAIFIALVMLMFATTGIAARYGRVWSVRAYDENLRQNIRALAEKQRYGAIERMALSVLKVTPEYEGTIREETAAFQYMLPELSAKLRGELSDHK